MAIIKYSVKPKEAPLDSGDPRRIVLTYDMIMAPAKELHISDSLYAFLTTSAAQEIRNLFAQLTQFGPENATDKLVLREDSGLACNYFAMRRGGEPVISYLPYAKAKEAAGQEWVKTSRQTMKPGRFLNTLFTAKTLAGFGITDKVIERFTNQVKSFVNVNVNMIEVDGELIEYWYSPARYSPKAGANLRNSCMNKNEFEATKFTFYAQNPNCHMLVALDDDFRLMGRALVWHNCSGYELRGGVVGNKTPTHTGITFMDRVYAGEDFVEEAFNFHAQKQGWYYREFKKATYQTQLVAPEGESVNMVLSVPSAMRYKLEDYPYVDSMKYLSKDLKTLYNYPDNAFGRMLTVGTDETVARAPVAQSIETDLDGMILASEVATCQVCKRTGNYATMYSMENTQGGFMKRICRHCLKAKYVNSGFEGRLIPKDEAVLVKNAQGYQDYVSKGNAVWSKHHDTFLIKAYARHLPIDDDWVRRHEDVVPSAFHNCFMWRNQSEWEPKLNSFIHVTRRAQADKAIELGIMSEAGLPVEHRQPLPQTQEVLIAVEA